MPDRCRWLDDIQGMFSGIGYAQLQNRPEVLDAVLQLMAAAYMQGAEEAARAMAIAIMRKVEATDE